MLKRFLIENENRVDSFISEDPNSQLEIVSTDWRPVAEVVFAKERGKDRKDNLEINLEAFISIKGINALGNQLTKDKVNQINLLDPLPYETPEEVHADELEVVDETEVSANETSANSDSKSDEPDIETNDEGQITLF